MGSPKLTMADLAARIHVHLQTQERAAHPERFPTNVTVGHKHVFYSGAYAVGRCVAVMSEDHRGTSNLSRENAKLYLEWLDAGNQGTYHDMRERTS